MNLKELNAALYEELTFQSKELGDFQLFLEGYELTPFSSIKEEIHQIFSEELEVRKAYDIRYELSSLPKAGNPVGKAIEKWFEYAGLKVNKSSKAVSLVERFLAQLSVAIKCYKLNECTYLKKGVNSRVEYILRYDYFLIKSETNTYVFEVGGDD